MVCNYSNTIAIKYGINVALIAGYIREKLEKITALLLSGLQ